MTQEETISNLKAYLDGDIAVGNIIPLRSILESAIKYLQEYPSLPSNLDEAAHSYAWKKQEHHIDFDGDEYLDYGPRYDAFNAGAEWMAGQGVTVEGYITGVNDVAAIIAFPRKEHNKGNKVIVQIRKK